MIDYTEAEIIETRTVSWFSCGAASAVATKLTNPDVIAYCHTGSEDVDNARFMKDCIEWWGKDVTVLKNSKYQDTWQVFESRRYLSGIGGAPCTKALKIEPDEIPDNYPTFGALAPECDFLCQIVEQDLEKG